MGVDIKPGRLWQFSTWQYLLVLLLCLHVIVNLLWITSNNAPLPWDTANHTSITFSILDKIKNFDFASILKVSNYYPIGVHSVTAFILLFTGFHIKLAEFIGTLYFLGTLVAIFLYVNTVIKNERGAFMTALFFSLSPIAFNWSRFLMLDIPSVGTLFFGLYFLEKSDRLVRRRDALLFFSSAAFLAMTKWTGIVYLTIPALLVGLSFIRASLAIKKQMLGNTLLGLVLFAAITLPWYLSNFHDLVFLGKTYSVDHSHPNQHHFWALNDFLDYIRIFIRDQVTPLPAFAFLLSLLALPFVQVPRKFFIPTMFFANLVFFSVLGNKDSRFTMHAVVFACLAFALVFELLYRRLRVIAIMLITISLNWSLGYFLVSSFRTSSFEVHALPITLPVLGRFDTVAIHKDLVKAYDPSDWSMGQLLRELSSRVKNGDRLLVVSEWEHLNPSNIRLTTMVHGMDKVEIDTADIIYLKEHYGVDFFPNQQALQDYVRDKDYALVAQDFVGSPILLNGKAVKQLQVFAQATRDLPCDTFQASASAIKTTCFVFADESLITQSDVTVDGYVTPAGQKTITGFAEVSCTWGCSFAVIKEPTKPTLPAPQLALINTYVLPNNAVEYLYRVVK